MPRRPHARPSRRRPLAAALLGVAGLLALHGASAQEGALEQAAGEPPPPPPLPAVPEPPDIPRQVVSGEAFEPDVTIRREDEKTITEYRVNGILQAVKVETEGFPTYYLVDTNGDGKVDARRSSMHEPTIIPQWVLFRW